MGRRLKCAVANELGRLLPGVSPGFRKSGCDISIQSVGALC